MGKQIIRLTENELRQLIKESINKVLNEMNTISDEWYNEEDYDGNIGHEGLIRSYDIGMVYDSNVEQEAQEMGYDNIGDYLRFWFDEVKPECPWYWTQKSGGFKNTLFRQGGVVCQVLPGGQIVIDEYAPGEAEYENDFNNRLTQGEFWTK